MNTAIGSILKRQKNTLNRRIRNRFTSEMLYRYIEALGIPTAEESFASERAILVEKIGPHAPDMGEFGFRE